MNLRAAPILALLALLAISPTPVGADCEPAGPPADVLPTAAVAFVGTVTRVTGAVATIAVSEVWAGQVGASVDVYGLRLGHPHGPDEAPASEDDRVWTVGRTYLVLPSAEGGVLQDNICTATTEWTDDLAELRPADAIIREPSAEGGSFPIAMPLIGLVVVVLVVASAFAFRRGGSAAR